jgi:hypothetical protein
LSSIEEAEAWARRNNIPETYIVTSGRAGGGFHFYFHGTRSLPDVNRNAKQGRVGFVLDGASGDVKCTGYVVLEGGIHPKSGATYVGNGKHVAFLPEFIRDYQDPKSVRIIERKVRRTQKHAATQTEIYKVPFGGRHNWLLSEAGRLRQLGLGEEALYLALQDLCSFCEGDKSDTELRGIAQYCAKFPCDRRVRTGLVIPCPQNAKGTRELIAGLLRREFPIGCIESIHSIVERINLTYPKAGRSTIYRALELAKFKGAGKDPRDGRKQLWTRCGTRKKQ